MTIADVQRPKRAAKKAPKASPASKQDLRAWLAALRQHNEVQEITGEREKEIGGIVDLYMRKMGNRAVLFDDIQAIRAAMHLANILIDPAHQSHTWTADRRFAH
jgi:hypothetical protein